MLAKIVLGGYQFTAPGKLTDTSGGLASPLMETSMLHAVASMVIISSNNRDEDQRTSLC